jgi:hypothetical protein
MDTIDEGSVAPPPTPVILRGGGGGGESVASSLYREEKASLKAVVEDSQSLELSGQFEEISRKVCRPTLAPNPLLPPPPPKTTNTTDKWQCRHPNLTLWPWIFHVYQVAELAEEKSQLLAQLKQGRLHRPQQQKANILDSPSGCGNSSDCKQREEAVAMPPFHGIAAAKAAEAAHGKENALEETAQKAKGGVGGVGVSFASPLLTPKSKHREDTRGESTHAATSVSSSSIMQMIDQSIGVHRPTDAVLHEEMAEAKGGGAGQGCGQRVRAPAATETKVPLRDVSAFQAGGDTAKWMMLLSQADERLDASEPWKSTEWVT